MHQLLLFDRPVVPPVMGVDHGGWWLSGHRLGSCRARPVMGLGRNALEPREPVHVTDSPPSGLRAWDLMCACVWDPHGNVSGLLPETEGHSSRNESRIPRRRREKAGYHNLAPVVKGMNSRSWAVQDLGGGHRYPPFSGDQSGGVKIHNCGGLDFAFGPRAFEFFLLLGRCFFISWIGLRFLCSF